MTIRKARPQARPDPYRESRWLSKASSASQHGLTLKQLSVLRQLLKQRGRPFAVQQIADELGFKRPVTYGALRALNLRGLVVVKAHSRVGRSAYYVATVGPALRLLATLRVPDPFQHSRTAKRTNLKRT